MVNITYVIMYVVIQYDHSTGAICVLTVIWLDLHLNERQRVPLSIKKYGLCVVILMIWVYKGTGVVPESTSIFTVYYRRQH